MSRSVLPSQQGGAKASIAYHPCSRPVSGRSGTQEVRTLLEDVRNGSLWRACVELSEALRSEPTYTKTQEVLMRHDIALWANSKYGRIRLASRHASFSSYHTSTRTLVYELSTFRLLFHTFAPGCHNRPAQTHSKDKDATPDNKNDQHLKSAGREHPKQYSFI